MNFKFKNKSGITLIALIITIIVMLILVAVSISVALNTGLFKSASDATKNWKSAQDAETNVGSEIKIGDKTYSSIEEYIEDIKPLPEIKAGEKATTTSKYETAVIPAGFTVSGIREETTIDGGLVIYDIPAGTTVDWTNPDSVKTAYNQFVWIPVKVNKTTEPLDTETNIAAFKRSEWTANAETGGERTGLDTKYTEPYSYDETNDYDTSTGIKSQIENLTKSIYKYGGFYIGRYEAGVKPNADGTSTPRTSRSDSQTADCVIQQDKYPYIYVKWGKSMSDISEGAVYLSNRLYNTNEYGATSMLCTGACWDSMLDFIKDRDHSVTDSSTWGNYNNSETFEITRGSYAVINKSNGTPGSFNNVGSKYSKMKDKDILLTTGATERNSAKNIYDVAGNCWEWTTESSSSNSRVDRGGGYGYGGLNVPAYLRLNSSADGSSSYKSFRSALYVNL